MSRSKSVAFHADSEARKHLDALLEKTSRTFAITIPLLPEPTRLEVTIAYLLFRVADTLEDATLWTRTKKLEQLDEFALFLERPTAQRATELSAQWSAEPPLEHAGYLQLMAELPFVLRATEQLSAQSWSIIARHSVRTTRGMASFVARESNGRLGLHDIADLKAYCYAVAGIVGEMLTELFLLGRQQLTTIATDLRADASAFGEGLQLVNILKDSDADVQEGRRYLPVGTDPARVECHSDGGRVVSVIVGVSAKGAPGVSLGIWSMLSCWPRPIVGLEADMSGGSWALTYGLSWDPGLSDLAAEQSPITPETIGRCSISLTPSIRVVCAPKEPVLVRRSLDWLDDRLAAWPEDLDVLVDAGRCDGSHPMLARADAVVVWCRTDPQGLGATAALLGSLERVVRPGVSVRIVTVGDNPSSPSESVEALPELPGRRLAVCHGSAVPFDPRLANTLASGGRKSARLADAWFGPMVAEVAASTAHRPSSSQPSSMPVTLGSRRLVS